MNANKHLEVIRVLWYELSISNGLGLFDIDSLSARGHWPGSCSKKTSVWDLAIFRRPEKGPLQVTPASGDGGLPAGIHSNKLTWNLKTGPLKRTVLYKGHGEVKKPMGRYA